jgi:DNA invertase Pin-like site-specific DNA recombinase
VTEQERETAPTECESVGAWPASGGVPVGVETEGTPVIGYLRVSTDRQVEEGFGLDVQLEAVEAWTAERGAVLVHVFRDEGKSGGEGLDVRLELGLALEAVQEGRGVGLVVPRLDRLARDLMVQEQLLAEVWRAGGEVWSCSKAESQYLVRDDPGDPSRKLIRQILGAVAEYERAMIRLRLAAGRARKHAAGGYAYGGPAVRLGGAGQAAGPGRGGAAGGAQDPGAPSSGSAVPSVRAIADQLNAEGLVTRRGKAWRGEQVRRVLAR